METAAGRLYFLLEHAYVHVALIFSYNTDDGGKYSAREERTFSRTCKSRVLCRYREYVLVSRSA